MKKTTLLLLSSVSLLAGCYSSPEMDENRYEDIYRESASACRQPEDAYQHKGFRRCLEDRIAYDNANKKTVKILQNDDGTALVVPKTYDDALMVEDNRVYEVVENGSNTVFLNESANITTVSQTTTVETTVTSGEKEDASETEDEITFEELDVIDDLESSDAEVKTEAETVTTVEETKKVETTEAVEVKTNEPPALATEEKKDDFPIVESVEEMPAEKKAVVETTTTETTTRSVSSNDGDVKGVTLIMGPLNEELVISVKSANSEQSKKKETVTQQVEKQEKIKTLKKSEKEYLPLEEK